MTTRQRQSKATAGKRANGEGSKPRQRKDGRWEVRVSEPGKPRKTLYGRTRDEVVHKALEARVSIKRGQPLPNGKLTVGKFLEQWLEESAKPSVRERTYINYRSSIEHVLPYIGTYRLNALTPAQVQACLNELLASGLAPGTVGSIRKILSVALGKAVRWDLVARNVVRLTDPPKENKRRVKALPPEDMRDILDAFSGTPMEALVFLALETGARRGELLGLGWEDVNLETGNLSIRRSLQYVNRQVRLVEPKTDRSARTIALSREAVAVLRSRRTEQMEQRLRAGTYWRDIGLVFTDELGGPLTPEIVSQHFAAHLKRSGLPSMHFHDLRHGSATLMLLQGVEPRVIMERLGHASIGITMNTYVHVLPQLDREAADGLGRLMKEAPKAM